LSAGKFPELPLMEDAEFYRSLRRCGGMRQSRMAIVGNQRRYEQMGAYRTTIYYVIILGLYLVGARMSTLISVYRRLTTGSCETPPRSHSASLAGFGSADGFPRSTTVPSGLRQ
jgi:hypothetical protein